MNFATAPFEHPDDSAPHSAAVSEKTNYSVAKAAALLGVFCQQAGRLRGALPFTFQDCPQARELMAGFPLRAISRANGIGNNGKAAKGRAYREVIITRHRAGRSASKRGGER